MALARPTSWAGPRGLSAHDDVTIQRNIPALYSGGTVSTHHGERFEACTAADAPPWLSAADADSSCVPPGAPRASPCPIGDEGPGVQGKTAINTGPVPINRRGNTMGVQDAFTPPAE
jgi:hypothetical protein